MVCVRSPARSSACALAAADCSAANALCAELVTTTGWYRSAVKSRSARSACACVVHMQCTCSTWAVHVHAAQIAVQQCAAGERAGSRVAARVRVCVYVCAFDNLVIYSLLYDGMAVLMWRLHCCLLCNPV